MITDTISQSIISQNNGVSIGHSSPTSKQSGSRSLAADAYLWALAYLMSGDCFYSR